MCPAFLFKGEKYYFRVYVHFQGNANGLEPSWMLPGCHIACFFCFWPVFQFNHFPSTVRAFVDISCVRKYLDNLEVSNTSLGILLLGTWYLQKSLLPHNGRNQMIFKRLCTWKGGSYPQILSPKKMKYFFFTQELLFCSTCNPELPGHPGYQGLPCLFIWPSA